jgi:hypothetical protein
MDNVSLFKARDEPLGVYCPGRKTNNYGGPFGAAEENFGRILKKDFLLHRDELIILSKAGWDMWPGPYGNYGSRKYLIARVAIRVSDEWDWTLWTFFINTDRIRVLL